MISEHERVRHGDVVEDVVYLRDVCGFLVAPFRDGYRINNDVVTKDELRERAAQERKRRPAPKPRAEKVAAAVPIVDCPCGRPSNHFGRCWVRRGLSASVEPADKSCGGVEGHAGQLLAPNRERGGVEQRRPRQAHKDRKAAGTPETAASGPVGIKADPHDSDIAARLDRLEQRMNDFFRLLAIAIGARRESLELLTKGLADLEAELSTNQRSE